MPAGAGVVPDLSEEPRASSGSLAWMDPRTWTISRELDQKEAAGSHTGTPMEFWLPRQQPGA